MVGDKDSSPDIAGLREFIRSTAGDAPPALVGRDTILADIKDTAQEVLRRFSANRMQPDLPGKLLRAIVGPPGAGKTSVLKHLRNTWNRETAVRSRRKPPVPIPVYFSASPAFESAEAVAMDLGNALQGNFGTSLVGHETETADRVGANWVVEGGRTKTKRERPIEDPIRHVPVRWRGPWTRPVVLMIDEFQRIGGSADSFHAKVLAQLHEAAYKLPILPVVAGLSNTVERATDLGLTRLGPNHVVAGLDIGEAVEAVVSWAGHFRVPLDPENRADGRRAGVLAGPCPLRPQGRCRGSRRRTLGHGHAPRTDRRRCREAAESLLRRADEHGDERFPTAAWCRDAGSEAGNAHGRSHRLHRTTRVSGRPESMAIAERHGRERVSPAPGPSRGIACRRQRTRLLPDSVVPASHDAKGRPRATADRS